MDNHVSGLRDGCLQQRFGWDGRKLFSRRTCMFEYLQENYKLQEKEPETQLFSNYF